MRRSGSRVRIARALAGCYPRRWRERYADEMRSLVEANPPRVVDLVDLARGCAREWVRDSGPSDVIRGVGLMTLAAAVVSLPAAVVGRALSPVARGWAPVLMTLELCVILAFCARLAWLVNGGRRSPWQVRPAELRRFSGRETRIWRVAIALSVVAFFASGQADDLAARVGWTITVLFNLHSWQASLLDLHASRPWFVYPEPRRSPRRPPAHPLNLS